MAKRLLRGIIDFGDNKVTLENLSLNYQRLSKSLFDWANPDEEKVFNNIRNYVQLNLELPDAKTIRDYFERANDITVLEALKDIEAAEIYTRTHYTSLLSSLQEEQNVGKIRRLLAEVGEIVEKGRTIEKVHHKGVKAGLEYFTNKVYEILPPDGNARTRGDVRDNTKEAWEEYQNAKINKDKTWGKFTGFEHIDKVCHGIKKGELWVHAAAPGHLKTTFALNWVYNLVTRYRTNVFYTSHEMKWEHIRRKLCAMHTSNGKFRERGLMPLDYRKIRDGELTPDEELFYQEALNDFETNPEYCRLELWCPDKDVTVNDIRIETELLHKRMEVGLLVIDHGGLIKSSKAHKEFTIEQNTVIRESKMLALHFNGGEGIPILMPFQINRKGMDSAGEGDEESRGKYKMSALAYANECEKSADYITTTFLDDELRNTGETIICNLKNRDNQLFELSRLRVDFSPGRMRNWERQDGSDIGHTELSLEELDNLMNRSGA